MGAVLAVLIVGVVVVSLSLQVVVVGGKFAQSISNCPMQTLAVLQVVVDVGFGTSSGTLTPSSSIFVSKATAYIHVMIVPRNDDNSPICYD